MSIDRKLQQAAAGAGGGIAGGTYIIAGDTRNTTDFTGVLTLLNHDAGSVSIASSYVMPNSTSDAAFSPDSEYIATAHSVEPNFTLFQNDGGSLVRAAGYTLADSGRSCAWHPSGDYIAVGHQGGDRLTVLNHSSGSVSLASTYNYGENVVGVDFSSDGSYMMACSDSTITQTLFSFSSGTLTREASYNTTSGTFSCKFRPDDNYIAIADQGGAKTVTILDHTTAGSLSFAATYQHVKSNDIDWSPDGNYLACGLETTGDTVFLFSVDGSGSLTKAATYSPDNQASKSVSFDPTGDYLAVGTTGNPGSSDFFVLLDHTTAGSLSFADTYTLANTVNTVAFNPEPS